MSIPVPMHGFGSGGARLNYRLLGGLEAPAVPAVNDIWIITDVDITGHVFNAKTPADAAEGMVWICTGTSGHVAFDVLKKNSIMVYPLSAKQYINGAWVTRAARIYQENKWVEWVTYLYNEGDDCYALTGGWAAYPYSAFKEESRVAPALKMEDACMRIVFPAATPGSAQYSEDYKRGAVFAENRIDLANISTLSVDITEFAGESVSGVLTCYLHLTTEKKDGYTPVATLNCTGVGTFELDVRKLNEKYYLAIANRNSYSAFTVGVSSMRCQ